MNNVRSRNHVLTPALSELRATRNQIHSLIEQSRRPQCRPLYVVGFLTSFALLFGACSSAPPPAAQTASTPAAASSSALKPLNQAALQALVDETVRDLLIPGAVVLLRTPQGEFVAGSGTTLLGATIKPDADTYFRIASNTKTMTAATIMLMAQEGKVGFDDPISKYVSKVPNGDKITIGQLLEMRSGIYNYTNAPEVAVSIDRQPARSWSPTELLAIAFKRPPNFAPGTAFEYCNTNYTLLGLVAEKVDGKSLSQVMQDRLFGPLNLRHTLIPAPAVSTLPEPYSHGYLYGSSSVALTGEPPYSAEMKAAARSGKLQPKDYTNVNHSFAVAAGGAVSTASDMGTWVEALVGGRLLNAEYQRRWLASLRPENADKPEGQKYGYGISEFSWGPNSIYFHGGETPGYNSKISYDPANKMSLIVWTNLPVSLDEEQTANTLWVKVLDHIYTVSPLAPAVSPTAAP